MKGCFSSTLLAGLAMKSSHVSFSLSGTAPSHARLWLGSGLAAKLTSTGHSLVSKGGTSLDAPPPAPSWAAFLSMRTLCKPSQTLHSPGCTRRYSCAGTRTPRSLARGEAAPPPRSPPCASSSAAFLIWSAVLCRRSSRSPVAGAGAAASGPNPSPSPAAGPGAACGRACQSPGIARGRSCMLAISRSAPLSAPVRPTCHGQAQG